MHTSANTRGASLLGALIFIAALVVSGFGQYIHAEEQEAVSISGVCEMGFDYISGFDVEKLSAERSKYQQSEDLPTKIYYARGGLASGRSVARSLDKGMSNQCGSIANGMLNTDNRICSDQGWKCKYAYCNPERDKNKTVKYNVSGKPEEACIIISKTVGVGQSMSTKEEAYAEAGKQAALPQDSPQRTQAEKFLSGGESAMSRGVLDNFVDSAKKANEQELLALQKKETDANAKIKAWEESWCPKDPWEGGISSCYNKKQDYIKAKEELSDIEQRRLALAKEAERLKGFEKRLEPSLSPPSEGVKNCPPGTPGCSNISQSPSDNRPGTFAYRAQPDNPFDRFLGPNTNQGQDQYCVVRLEPIVVEQYPARPGCYNYKSNVGGGDRVYSGNPQERSELEEACRYGNQSACQRLAGGGYGGYGGASGGNQGGQSNRCGSQPNFGGGLGGIIGGVISLFTKNSGGNSNCVDGVPKPQCTLTANPKNISRPGEQVTLSWQSDDAFSATLSSNGSVGVNGSQVVQPQQTTTYTLSLQGYRNTQTGQVLSGQCSTKVTVGNATGTPSNSDPKAQISCSPQKADVGMSVAVSFSCLNSNTSSGSGFSTNNQLSGSATPVVTTPTLGSSSVTYGLTCSKDGKTDSAQCTVEVNKTAIVLIANPKIVESGEEANIGWVTTGMQSCTISSPQLSGFTSDNAGGTSVSGVARTPPLTNDATFVLTCISRSGATKTAETKVEVGN